MQDAGPYRVDSPVGGTAAFVGRAVLLRTLQTGLAQGRSFALFGGPKTGRTSTLQQLVHLAHEQLRRPHGSAKMVPVYFDVGSAPARPQQFLNQLWEAIHQAVLDPRVQSHPNPPRPPKVDIVRTAAPWDAFHAACTELWTTLANTPGWCHYTLLLDNADALADAAFNTLHSPLVALATGPGAGRPSGFVLAGGTSLVQLCARPKSPWAALRGQMLGVLRESECQALLRVGRLQDAPQGPDLLAAAGSHPHVLQCALAALFAAPEASAQDLLATLATPLAPGFQALWDAFGPLHNSRGVVPLEHLLMQLLLQQGGAEMAYQEAETALGRVSLKLALDFLDRCAIVERQIRGNTPCIRAGCDLFNAFYQARMAA